MYSKFLTATAIILCATTASAENAAKWAPTFELEGRTNSDRSLISPKFLIPLAQDDDSMLFTDIRTRLDDNSSEEYNIGLGYRTIRNSWIFGGYAFADYLSSPNGKAYWQGTAGLEALSENWDARINGYLPENTKHQLSAVAGGLTIDGGGNFGISSGGGSFERALPGIDAEVGYRLPLQDIDLRVFGGGYYFGADDFKSVTGPKARVELTLNEDNTDFLTSGMELTFGVQYQNDGPREGTTTALAQFRIPFWADEDSKKLSPLKKRMTNFIERDVDIVTKSGTSVATTSESATLTLNGQNYTSIAATLDGSTANAQNVLDAVGGNTLILVNGNPSNTTTALNLIAGQALIGGGANVTVTGNTSGNNFSGNLPGSRPTLAYSVNLLGSNAMLKNITFNSTVDTILLNTLNNILIEDVAVNSGASGIYVYNSSNVILRNITVQNIDTAGIVTNGASNLTIDGADIINTTSDGFYFLNTNIVDLTDVTVNTNSGNALTFIDATNVTGNAELIGSANPCSLTGNNSGSSINLAGGGTCP